MIVAINTIKIKSGHAGEVAERFKNPKGVQHAPGFVRMELLIEALEEHDELKVCTTWESREAFDGWVNSDAFKQAHAHSRPKPGDQPAHGGGHPQPGDQLAHGGGHPQPGDRPAHGGGHPQPGDQPAHGGGHPQPGDRPAHGGGHPQPGEGIMLGAKLSVHDVVFGFGKE